MSLALVVYLLPFDIALFVIQAPFLAAEPVSTKGLEKYLTNLLAFPVKETTYSFVSSIIGYNVGLAFTIVKVFSK